tara:strand:+ start:765 stop:971 length:207 start_codon:yes stop_codon:yes gene_type:complete
MTIHEENTLHLMQFTILELKVLRDALISDIEFSESDSSDYTCVETMKYYANRAAALEKITDEFPEWSA